MCASRSRRWWPRSARPSKTSASLVDSAAQGRPPERSGRRQLHLLPSADPEVDRRARRTDRTERRAGRAAAAPAAAGGALRVKNARADHRARQVAGRRSQRAPRAVPRVRLARGAAHPARRNVQRLEGRRLLRARRQRRDDQALQRRAGTDPGARPRAARRAGRVLGRRQSLHPPRRRRIRDAPCSCRW